jgi:hypothetical protein
VCSNQSVHCRILKIHYNTQFKDPALDGSGVSLVLRGSHDCHDAVSDCITFKKCND